MRKVTAGVALGLTLLASLLAGCNLLPGVRNQDRPPPPAPAKVPDVPALVNYLNQNAALVQAVRSDTVDIQCMQGRQAIGLGGMLVCRKPRDFRLRAKVVGNPAVDIGSNSEEFWYWISKADPPHVYHCSYRDLATGKVFVPFPFQPDMLVAALGIAEYDPKGKYDLKVYPKYLELVESTVSPSGEAVQRITVFNRTQAPPGQPQVLAHVLKDTKGKLICQANIHEVVADPITKVALPTKVTLEWPAQKVKMTMRMYDIKAVSITPAEAARYFQRTGLSEYDSYDLARRVIDTPGGSRRAARGSSGRPGR
jgi:hypothetical protein